MFWCFVLCYLFMFMFAYRDIYKNTNKLQSVDKFPVFIVVFFSGIRGSRGRRSYGCYISVYIVYYLYLSYSIKCYTPVRYF